MMRVFLAFLLAKVAAGAGAPPPSDLALGIDLGGTF
jgi:hypothetical protein